MKSVIDILKKAIRFAVIDYSYAAISCIKKAIDELEARPKWETPEQYRERTGKAWPDKGPVWFRHTCGNYQGKGKPDFIAWWLKEYKDARDDYDFYLPNYKQIVCATEAGMPPKDWRPEGK
jgi:hypothetical protein